MFISSVSTHEEIVFVSLKDWCAALISECFLALGNSICQSERLVCGSDFRMQSYEIILKLKNFSFTLTQITRKKYHSAKQSHVPWA